MKSDLLQINLEEIEQDKIICLQDSILATHEERHC